MMPRHTNPERGWPGWTATEDIYNYRRHRFYNHANGEYMVIYIYAPCGKENDSETGFDLRFFMSTIDIGYSSIRAGI